MSTGSDKDTGAPGGESLPRNSISEAAKDDATLPEGILDPVYDAKARVLNRAVSKPSNETPRDHR
jgi:hypothetical protein